jgi:hypothetical protein
MGTPIQIFYICPNYTAYDHHIRDQLPHSVLQKSDFGYERKEAATEVQDKLKADAKSVFNNMKGNT